jgi:hypothetical protein
MLGSDSTWGGLRVPERWERHLIIESFGIHLRATDKLSSVTMNPLNRLERTMTGGIIAMAVSLEGASELGSAQEMI